MNDTSYVLKHDCDPGAVIDCKDSNKKLCPLVNVDDKTVFPLVNVDDKSTYLPVCGDNETVHAQVNDNNKTVFPLLTVDNTTACTLVNVDNNNEEDEIDNVSLNRVPKVGEWESQKTESLCRVSEHSNGHLEAVNPNVNHAVYQAEGQMSSRVFEVKDSSIPIEKSNHASSRDGDTHGLYEEYP